MLIGLPDLAKERKLSKIVINRRLLDILEVFENASPYFCTFLANRIGD